MQQILYIGAATHFQPCRDFHEVKTFVFFDSEPYADGTVRRSEPWRQIRSSEFMGRLMNAARVYGFRHESSSIVDPTFVERTTGMDPSEIPDELHPTMHVFRNDAAGQVVYYYTSFPVGCIDTPDIVRGCDTLVVSGYHPKTHVLAGIPSKTMRFVGYNQTWYGYDGYVDTEKDFDAGTVMSKAFAESFFRDFLFLKQDSEFLRMLAGDDDFNAWFLAHEPVSSRIRFHDFEDFRDHALTDWNYDV